MKKENGGNAVEAESRQAARQPVSTTDCPSVFVPERPRRILQVACFYPPRRPLGGGTIVCSDLTKGLLNAHEVEVFAGGINDPPVSSTYELGKELFEGATVYRIVLEYENFEKLAAQYWNPIVNARFDYLLKRLAPDIIHFHGIQGLGAGLLICAAKRGIPTVVTVHDSWWLCARQFFLLWDGRTICSGASLPKCALCITRGRRTTNAISRLTKPFVSIMFSASTVVRFFLLPRILSATSLVMCPSKYLQGLYLKYGFSTTISRNGIPSGLVKRRLRVSHSEIVFGFAGGTSPEKGFGLVMEATSKLNQEKLPVDIKVRIWGSGDPRALGLACTEIRGVQFLGEVDRSQSMGLLEDVDVLLFPSFMPENRPLTVLESLRSGAPVVASRVGGIPELVQDGFNGLLFAPGDASELSECMVRLARNPKLLALMSRNALAVPVRTMEQQAAETSVSYAGLRLHKSRPSISLGFNIVLATSLFWIQVALVGIWKAAISASRTFAVLRELYKLDPALRTPMTGELSKNIICKTVACEVGCVIKEVRLFCDNLDEQPHALTVSLYWALNESPFAVRNMRIPARHRASWLSVSVGERCEQDVVYITIRSDSDRYGRVGYDLERPLDQQYRIGDGVFRAQKARVWAKIVTTAGIFGVDVAESERLPAKPSRLQDLMFSVAVFPILFALYIAGKVGVPTLTRVVRWKKRPGKRRGEIR
jgi:glycosyltransferase involved in cell wall biosynthesis